jgi:hypothetical protein
MGVVIVRSCCVVYALLLPFAEAGKYNNRRFSLDRPAAMRNESVATLIASTPSARLRKALTDLPSLSKGKKASLAPAANAAVHELVNRLKTPPQCTPPAGAKGESFKLDFGRSEKPASNNLGGLGPMGGKRSIRYEAVARMKGMTLDLLISNMSRYRAQSTEFNGQQGNFGHVNILPVSTPSVPRVPHGSDEAAFLLLAGLEHHSAVLLCANWKREDDDRGRVLVHLL